MSPSTPSPRTESAAPPPGSARERLLDAAVEAFGQNGFASTTTRDIASRAGMSPAAVYVHHASKEDLLFAVSLAGHVDALAALRSSDDPSASPRERAKAMIAAFTRWHAHHSQMARVVQHEISSLTPEHRAEIAHYRRQMSEAVRDVLRDGVADGSLQVDDINGTALAMLSIPIDLVRWYSPDGPTTPDQLAELYSELAGRMIVSG